MFPGAILPTFATDMETGKKKGFDFLAQGNMSSAAVDAMKLLGSTKIGSYYVLPILFGVRGVY